MHGTKAVWWKVYLHFSLVCFFFAKVAMSSIICYLLRYKSVCHSVLIKTSFILQLMTSLTRFCLVALEIEPPAVGWQGTSSVCRLIPIRIPEWTTLDIRVAQITPNSCVICPIELHRVRFSNFVKDFFGWFWPYGAQLGKWTALSHALGVIWATLLDIDVIMDKWDVCTFWSIS